MSTDQIPDAANQQQPQKGQAGPPPIMQMPNTVDQQINQAECLGCCNDCCGACCFGFWISSCDISDCLLNCIS